MTSNQIDYCKWRERRESKHPKALRGIAQFGNSKEVRAFHIWNHLDKLPAESRASFLRDNAAMVERFKAGYVPGSK